LETGVDAIANISDLRESEIYLSGNTGYVEASNIYVVSVVR
jgi:hypothetical protein